jgi:hypothetical protein
MPVKPPAHSSGGGHGVSRLALDQDFRQREKRGGAIMAAICVLLAIGMLAASGVATSDGCRPQKQVKAKASAKASGVFREGNP